MLFAVIYFYQPAIKTRNSYFFIDSVLNWKQGLIEMFKGIFDLKQVMLLAVLLLVLMNTLLNYLVSTELYKGLNLVVFLGLLVSFVVGVMLMYGLLWYEELTILPM